MHATDGTLTAWRAAAESHGAEVVDRTVVARPAYVPPELPPGDLTPSLRFAILAALSGGVLGLVVADVLTGGAALVWPLVMAAAWAVGHLRPATQGGTTVRTIASTGVVAIAALLAFLAVGAEQLPAGVAALLCGITTAQLISARTRRDGLVALSLGPVMIVTAAGFGPGPSLVLPTVVVASAVLAGLAAVAGSALEDGASSGAAQARRSGLPSGTAIPIAVVVVLGLVAFLVLPLGSAPTMGASLLGARQRAPDPAAEAALRTTSYFGDAMDLAARGRLPDTTAFTREARLPAAVARADPRPGPRRGLVVADDLHRGRGRGRPRRAARRPGRRRRAASAAREEYVVRPTSVSMLVSPGPPRSVAGPLVVDQTHTNAFIVDSGTTPYQVTAVPQEGIDALERSGSGPDRTEAVFVTPDPTTTVRTAELARTITAGLTDRVAQVQAIESWLRANVRYQLDAPLPPADRDAVDFLLFDSRAGFCEHFAAAEAVMLRSLGIPSRIATGFAVTDEVIDTQGWSVVRDSDAHAWVEVWIEGHGWVSSDPTAGSVLLDPASEASPVQRLRDAWNRLWSDDAGRRMLAFVLIGLTALAAVVVVVLRRRRTTHRAAATASRTATLEPLAAFGRFRAALMADGHGFEPGDGVAEVRLAVAGDAELQAALDVVERTLYDRDQPSSQRASRRPRCSTSAPLRGWPGGARASAPDRRPRRSAGEELVEPLEALHDALLHAVGDVLVARLERLAERGRAQQRPAVAEVGEGEPLERDGVGHAVEGEGLHDELAGPHVVERAVEAVRVVAAAVGVAVGAAGAAVPLVRPSSSRSRGPSHCATSAGSLWARNTWAGGRGELAREVDRGHAVVDDDLASRAGS